jgi:hypothetical protein
MGEDQLASRATKVIGKPSCKLSEQLRDVLNVRQRPLPRETQQEAQPGVVRDRRVSRIGPHPGRSEDEQAEGSEVIRERAWSLLMLESTSELRDPPESHLLADLVRGANGIGEAGASFPAFVAETLSDDAYRLVVARDEYRHPFLWLGWQELLEQRLIPFRDALRRRNV